MKIAIDINKIQNFVLILNFLIILSLILLYQNIYTLIKDKLTYDSFSNLFITILNILYIIPFIIFKKLNKKAFYYGLFILTLLLFFITRTLNTQYLDNKLLALDPYVFHRYASYIVKYGYLPWNDTYRYYPHGFLIWKEHPSPSHAIALLYYILHPFGFDLMRVNQLYSVIFATLSIIALFLFLKEVFDEKIASLSVFILTSIPSFLFRTMQGFGDKEPQAILWIFLGYYFYVKFIKTKNWKFSLFSGISAGLGSLTWGGSTFLILPIIAYQIISLVQNKKQEIGNIIWNLVLLIIPLSILSMRYKIYSTPWILLSLFVVLASIIEYLLKNIKMPIKKDSSSHISFLLAFLIGVAFLVFVGKVDIIIKFIQTAITDPLASSKPGFQSTVSENQPPFFYDPQRKIDWWHSFYFLIPISIFGFYYLAKKSKDKYFTYIVTSLLLLILFSRLTKDPNYPQINLSSLYYINLAIFFGYFIYGIIKDKIKFDGPTLLFFIFTILTLIVARGAVRILFMASPIIAVLSSIGIVNLIKEKNRFVLPVFIFIFSFSILPLSIITRILISLIFGLIGGYLLNTIKETNYRSLFFYFLIFSISSWLFLKIIYSSALYTGPNIVYQWDAAFEWIKNNTDKKAVFYHWWDYGYWIQTIADRATVLDGGNYESPYKTAHYFFSSSNKSEWKQVLEYYKPNYLFIVDDDILKFGAITNIAQRYLYFTAYSYQGVQPNLRKDLLEGDNLIIFSGSYFPIQEDFRIGNKIYDGRRTYVAMVLLPQTNNSISGLPYVFYISVDYGEQKIGRPKCICMENQGCYEVEGDVPICIEPIQGGIVLIPWKTKDMLFTRLFLLNESIPGFELVYDNGVPLSTQAIYNNAITKVKIWKININEIN